MIPIYTLPANNLKDWFGGAKNNVGIADNITFTESSIFNKFRQNVHNCKLNIL